MKFFTIGNMRVIDAEKTRAFENLQREHDRRVRLRQANFEPLKPNANAGTFADPCPAYDFNQDNQQ